MRKIRMEIAHFWWILVGILGPVIGNLFMIGIVVVLFFVGKHMVVNSLKSYLPENIVNTVTNIFFGILIIYFAMKMFKR